MYYSVNESLDLAEDEVLIYFISSLYDGLVDIVALDSLVSMLKLSDRALMKEINELPITLERVTPVTVSEVVGRVKALRAIREAIQSEVSEREREEQQAAEHNSRYEEDRCANEKSRALAFLSSCPIDEETADCIRKALATLGSSH